MNRRPIVRVRLYGISILTILTLGPVVGLADTVGYYSRGLNTYDPDSGLYFRTIEEKEENHAFLSKSSDRSRIVNLNIFDPTSGTSKLLFPTPVAAGIDFILFETQSQDGAIEFIGSHNQRHILNNTPAVKRSPKNKLLIGTRAKDSKVLRLFTSDKRGNNLSLLTEVAPGTQWHIDARNSKLRLVTQTKTGISIDSLDW